MARATLATVQRLVYDNLGLTDVTYGTLLTSNQRYLSGYINDKIAEADIDTMMILLKNKQHVLLRDSFTVSGNLASGGTVPNAWGIIDVTLNNPASSVIATEVPYGVYEQLAIGGIYATDLATYTNFYSLRDSKIYYVGAASAIITYIDMTHPTTLTALISPTGFEGAVANLASANLLMKRGDKPEQAKFYMELYMSFMQQFMLPDSNVPDIISD